MALEVERTDETGERAWYRGPVEDMAVAVVTLDPPLLDPPPIPRLRLSPVLVTPCPFRRQVARTVVVDMHPSLWPLIMVVGVADRRSHEGHPQLEDGS